MPLIKLHSGYQLGLRSSEGLTGARGLPLEVAPADAGHPGASRPHEARLSGLWECLHGRGTVRCFLGDFIYELSGRKEKGYISSSGKPKCGLKKINNTQLNKSGK